MLYGKGKKGADFQNSWFFTMCSALVEEPGKCDLSQDEYTVEVVRKQRDQPGSSGWGGAARMIVL